MINSFARRSFPLGSDSQAETRPGPKTGRFNCPVIVSACEDAESGKCRQSFEMSGAFNRIVTSASERRGTLQSLNERKHTSKMLSVSDQTVFLNERTRREDAC
ncbi:hypothetical protein CesoFtcFv8_009678 [Champsocephalus esox]|uniref:Uncharacterized protein n=1 Tax=Champsocephalus esox TaxID=159716 RepID=A0AAN8C4B2_9TELE|nr:hypothetical protein CesoFtcFv8_009678 [Champsocephalus esox]